MGRRGYIYNKELWRTFYSNRCAFLACVCMHLRVCVCVCVCVSRNQQGTESDHSALLSLIPLWPPCFILHAGKFHIHQLHMLLKSEATVTIGGKHSAGLWWETSYPSTFPSFQICFDAQNKNSLEELEMPVNSSRCRGLHLLLLPCGFMCRYQFVVWSGRHFV